MTEVREEGREGSSLAAAAPETLRAEAPAQRANSITLPDSVALQAVADSARAARRVLTSAAALLDRPGSLSDAQPPTFRQARDWHHKCAGHYEALILRWPRLLWGYVHLLLVMPALRFAEWVTASPARAAVAAFILAAAWYGK